MLWRAEIAQPGVRLAREAFQESGGQARLADSGLAREQHHLALARLRLGPAMTQEIALFLAPDQRRRPARVQRIEAALLRALPEGREGARGAGDALEVPRAEIDQLE